MALTTTIDATYGGPAANSYVADLAEAETLVTMLKALKGYGVDASGWDAVGSPSGDTKKIAMIQGCARLDTALFVGQQANTAQARQFPRTDTGQIAMDYPALAAAPDILKLAQMAEACSLLLAQNDVASSARRGVVSETIGDHSTTFDRGGVASSEANQLSDAAYKMLRNAGLILGGSGSVYIPRG